MERHVGIAGIGTYLPPEVRTNAWWPAEVVEQWMAQRRATKPPVLNEPSEGMLMVLAAMSRQALDPFQGMIERRVMPQGMTSVDMEAEAARKALDHANVDPGEIDLLLSHTPVPEFLLSNTSCVLHAALGLRPECRTMQVDASGNSFLMQLSLAEQLIASGHANRALIVQSAAGSRLVEPSEPQSPLFGDGAAAVVVAPVGDKSVLATVHRTDSSQPRTLIATVRGGRWYDGGKIVLHRGDLVSALRSFLETADRAREVVEPALAQAGVTADQIEFFAAHQGTPWMREVTMQYIGMSSARYVDMMPTMGYLFGASIPFVLETAHKKGTLEAGQLVLAMGGGVGATTTAMVLRWGKLGR